MGRQRLYASTADRQRAYRNRVLTANSSPSGLSPPVPPPRRRPSRPARLRGIMRALVTLQQEYEAWQQAMLENQQDGAQAERVDEVIEQLGEVIDLLSALQPPKGFGRD